MILIFGCILLLSMLSMMLFSSIIYEKLYVRAKKNELMQSVLQVNSYFEQNELISTGFREGLVEHFDRIERNNVEIIWFVYDRLSAEVDIAYATKITGRFMINEYPNVQQVKENIAQLILDGALEDINLYSYADYEMDIGGVENISFVSMVFDSTQGQDNALQQTQQSVQSYIIFNSPKEYVALMADTANRFVIYVSLATMLVAFLAVVIISNRITKPVAHISKVASKISSLDFSENADEHGKDEIADLGRSINQMSKALQQSIDYLKKRAQILKDDLEKQELSNESNKQFIASVSHDFKTPLSLILAYGELLSEKYPEDEQTQEQLHIVMNQALKMNLMVNQLLTLSALESGTAKLNKSVFVLNEVVHSVLEELKIMIEQSDIKLSFSYQDDFIVLADYSKILQVLTNLVENAIKYCDEKKIVNISINRINNNIRLTIYNTHPKISEQSLLEIFDSFYKQDSSREKSSGSYGLGLSIVKSIMQMHNMPYGVYNSNAGIVFWFELQEALDEDFNT